MKKNNDLEIGEGMTVKNTRRENLAPCGVDCSQCYVFTKSEHSCLGCTGEDVHKPMHCRHCAIARCAKDRNEISCYMCVDFPCKRIEYNEVALKASMDLRRLT